MSAPVNVDDVVTLTVRFRNIDRALRSSDRLQNGFWVRPMNAPIFDGGGRVVAVARCAYQIAHECEVLLN